MNPQQQQQGIESKHGWNLLIFGNDCCAYCWEIFVRIPRSMGSDYPGWPVRIGAFFAFPLFMCFAAPRYGGAFILPWWCLTMGLMLMHLAMAQRSRAWHSYYIGDSVAWKLDRNLAIARRRMLPELGLAITLASVTALLCDTVAKFVLVSAVCSCISLALMRERDRRIAQRLRNQQYEADYYGDVFQNPNGGRR